MPREVILAESRTGCRFAPVVGFPGTVERYVLRRTLGQVHSRHLAAIN
jgi:hypothetical protein